MTGCPRPELGVLPPRIAALPLDARGYPVPWFVEWVDGAPEFRVMDGRKFARAVKERRCWVCGGDLGKFMAFVIGPMGAVNRTSGEPPSHYDCAAWSARHCPFLTRPHMVRREDDVVNQSLSGDASLARNPGCAGVWVTGGYRLFKAPGASATGWLIEMGTPSRVEWYAEGRSAARAEVLRSVETGLPALEAICEAEPTAEAKDAAIDELQLAVARADAWFPA